LLTEVGFLAAARGDVRRAEVIFGALERLRPHGAFVYVGLAATYLNAARAEDAVRVLDRGLPLMAADDRGEVQAMRSLALQLAGRASESVSAARDAETSNLARAMLGQGRMQAEENQS
jgi:thioredoxin-like negative regulator of GroEL